MNIEDMPQVVARDVLRQLIHTGQPPKGAARYLTVGFNDILTHLENEILDGVIQGGYCAIRIIFAQNGNGKTHLCRDILERAESRGYSTAELDLAPNSNFANPIGLYQSIAQQVTYSLNGQTMQGIDNIVAASDSWQEIKKDHRISPPFRDCASLLAKGTTINSEDSLRQAIRGEPIPPALRRVLKFKEALSTRNAMRWVRDITLLLETLGSQGFVVVLDETEQTDTARKRELQSKLTMMLNLVNGAASGDFARTLFLVTTVPGTMSGIESSAELKPLRQRLYPMSLLATDRINPRGIKIDSDGGGGLSDRVWMESAANRIMKIAEKSGKTINHERKDLVASVIEKHELTAVRVEKRAFIREVGEIAATG